MIEAIDAAGVLYGRMWVSQTNKFAKGTFQSPCLNIDGRHAPLGVTMRMYSIKSTLTYSRGKDQLKKIT